MAKAIQPINYYSRLRCMEEKKLIIELISCDLKDFFFFAPKESVSNEEKMFDKHEKIKS